MSAHDASTFDVIPAIDLRGGRVVRLEQGDFDRESVFSADPARQARAYADAGSSWLHVVDLDGARAGERRQIGPVGDIVRAARSTGVALRIQVAGGVRDAGAVAAVLAAGADRVVLGTAAITTPALVRRAVYEHGTDRVAAALDVRDGSAVGDGWVPGGSSRPFRTVLDELTLAGVTTVIVTAVARDGLLGGPDLELLEECVLGTAAAVIASGGIRSIDDLGAVRHVGCRGAIVGRALYDGRIDLQAAIKALTPVA